MADGGVAQFLSTAHGGDGLNIDQNSPLLASTRECESSSSAEDDDIKPINGIVDFAREFFIESKNLWHLAGPAIFTSFCQYGLITITQIFSGHLGTNQLAAVSVENSIISGFPYGLMFGMSSALETYCGQAFGANQYEMLGIYMQRTWVILNAMAFASVPLFIFAAPVLKFLGQTALVSREAGRFALWMIPEHFAYAITFPSTKFLQAQSKVIVLAVIAAAALCLHAVLSWLLITILGWGLVGAAVALDASWWFIAVAQFLFIITGSCREAWSGFSWKAFQDLWRFVKMSVASAMMMCMELWYVFALTLFAGYLEDAEISIDAFSICINVLGWACMVANGLNVATSVRVSNELGCGHPRKSRFAVLVSGVSSLLLGLLSTLILIISRKQYPAIFSNSSEVQKLVEQLTPLLGISIIFTNVQYTLQGVAIGAGWQVPVAYMSIGCYFLFGVPLGVLMAYKFEMKLEGLWCGMVLGLCLQTSLLMWMICIANWNKECFKAEERLKQWS
ncbi:MATE efflux family protein [Perilla frutescens var. hirtella]|nr:MATE efflux family protein [Perilla frutescens var. hirtella]